MRAVLCLVAMVLPCVAADLRQLEPLITKLRADPNDGRAVTIRAMNEVLRPWLDGLVAPFGYSPGPATVASKLNAELATVLGAERVCGSAPEPGCIGPVRIMDLREPYLMVVRTSVALPCGFEEAAYVYEWSNSRWSRRLAIDEEPTVSGAPRQFEYFDVSKPNTAGRRVLASAALIHDCQRFNNAIAEMRVYTFDDRLTTPVVFDRRAVLLEDEPISVRAEPSLAQFESTVASVSREPETRRAVNTYAVSKTSARRVQPVARTVRGFVEEWLTTPWEYALGWSGPDPSVMQAHDALSAEEIQGDFLSTTGCEGRVSEVGIENVVVRSRVSTDRVPEVYFKVHATGPDTYTLFKVSSEADETCE